MKTYTTKGLGLVWVIVLLAIALGAVLVITNNKEKISEDDDFSGEPWSLDDKSLDDDDNKNNNDDDSADKNLDDTMTTIKIPLVVGGGGAEGSYDEGPFSKFGCGDRLEYISVDVPYTTMPLTAVYEKLDELQSGPTFNNIMYDNYFGQLTDNTGALQMNFDYVTVADGVAHVYLTGNIPGGHCADPRIKMQIEYAAFQFDSVSEVKTYLNAELFDWQAFMSQDAG